MENIETVMARLCNRLMGAEQQALDTLTYTLDEMEYLAEQNPDRDDIKACIDEIKQKVKADESEHWAICNRWGEHFDGIDTSSDDASSDNDSGADKTESDTGNDSD